MIKLRESVYEIDETYKDKIPTKPVSNDIDNYINYCNGLIKILSKDDKLKFYQGYKKNKLFRRNSK